LAKKALLFFFKKISGQVLYVKL